MNKYELQQCAFMLREVKRYRLQLRQLEDGLHAVASEGIQGGDVSKPTERLAVKRLEVAARHNRALNNYKLRCAEIEDAIRGLETLEKDIIRMRYIEDMTWDVIGSEIAYSARHARRIHDRAVEKIK